MFSLSKVERQVKCLRTPSRFKRGGLVNFNMIFIPQSFTEIYNPINSTLSEFGGLKGFDKNVSIIPVFIQ